MFSLGTGNWSSCVDSKGVATIGCIWVVLQNIINAALALAGVTAVIFIIWAGIGFVTSQGDQERIASAKKTLTFAIIGLLLILFSLAIFNFVLTTTGISPSSAGVNIPAQ